MKAQVFVFDRKKLIFTAVLLLGVFLPLLAASYTIQVEEVTGQADKMQNYTSEREHMSFEYPQGWLTRVEKDFSGKEIIENIAFWNSDNTAHGFVQVMRLNKPITDYLQEAQETMRPGFDSLNVKETSLKGKTGYLLTYRRGQGDARSIAVEYFFKQNDRVYRFSCFYPEGLADEYAKVFTEMLNTFSF